jgi:hypothetical protein
MQAQGVDTALPWANPLGGESRARVLTWKNSFQSVSESGFHTSSMSANFLIVCAIDILTVDIDGSVISRRVVISSPCCFVQVLTIES